MRSNLQVHWDLGVGSLVDQGHCGDGQTKSGTASVPIETDLLRRTDFNSIRVDADFSDRSRLATSHSMLTGGMHHGK